MLRGLTTVVLHVDDIVSATRWYAELLGIEPYFERQVAGSPAYIEFRIGDYQHELGFLDRRYAPHAATPEPAGAVVYWHVDDLPGAYERALALGAKEHQPPTERGPGFVTASVVDPFGNILGLMFNQHYLDVLAS
ncbi:VOC family protein [Actinomycetes bacterium KLBMP 9797]